MTLHFTDPARCAEATVDRVGREIVLAIPIGIGKPNLLVNALYGLVESDRTLRLEILTGLTLVRPAYRSDLDRRFITPLLDRLFPSWPEVAYVAAIEKGRLPPNVEVHEFFLQAGRWLSNNLVQQSYSSLNYSHVSKHLQGAGTNVLAQLVAPHPDGDPSTVSLSSNTDITLDMADYMLSRRKAGLPVAVVGEINANLPYMPGLAEVPRDGFDAILEPATTPYDLFAPPNEPVTLTDYAMALLAATLVKDGGTLQIGIGSFADALVHALILRHTRNAEFRALVTRLGTPLLPDPELGPFTQGVYGCSEMLVDGFLALRRAGILRRKVPAGQAGKENNRQAVLHAGFFVGSQQFYRELREMPRAELEEIVMTAISFTNTLHGDTERKIEQRRDARFVNTALTATLLGAVSSDQLEDGRVVSGVGGQGDFVAMAHDLPGARSIIAVRSARSAGRGKRVSNIVWRYANTSIPRQLRDMVITEYGIADVRGRSDGEVAAAMLAIADSAFQPELQRAAQAAGKLKRRHVLPEWARSNRQERIDAALSEAQREGLLPVFPLGTEMTETEMSLILPLRTLRSAPPLTLFGVLARGSMAGPVSGMEAAALARLALDRPSSIKERALRALVLGAMRPAP
jgi:acyl-CoA hydrolase